jgi:hypothetical protein
VGRAGVAPPEPQWQEIHSLLRYYLVPVAERPNRGHSSRGRSPSMGEYWAFRSFDGGRASSRAAFRNRSYLRNNTPSTSKSFSYLLAAEAGFEPALDGLTIRCTTDCATRQQFSRPVHGHRAAGPDIRADRPGSADVSRRHSAFVVPSPSPTGKTGYTEPFSYVTSRSDVSPTPPVMASTAFQAVCMGTKKAPGPLPRGFCLRMCARSGHGIHRSHRASGYMERITI